MTMVEATLYGAAIAGVFTLLGVVVGLFGERWVRSWGKVRCEIELIELWVLGEGEPITLHRLPIPPDLLPDPEGVRDRDSWGEEEAVRYFVNAKFFNEKETKTGLRDVVIAFDVKPPFERMMEYRGVRRRSDIEASVDWPDVVDLPSREWVTLSLIDQLSLEDARKLTECDRAWLRGNFPDGGRFRQRVPFADPNSRNSA
jgi:hypothetical protein